MGNLMRLDYKDRLINAGEYKNFRLVLSPEAFLQYSREHNFMFYPYNPITGYRPVLIQEYYRDEMMDNKEFHLYNIVFEDMINYVCDDGSIVFHDNITLPDYSGESIIYSVQKYNQLIYENVSCSFANPVINWAFLGASAISISLCGITGASFVSAGFSMFPTALASAMGATGLIYLSKKCVENVFVQSKLTGYLKSLWIKAYGVSLNSRMEDGFLPYNPFLIEESFREHSKIYPFFSKENQLLVENKKLLLNDPNNLLKENIDEATSNNRIDKDSFKVNLSIEPLEKNNKEIDVIKEIEENSKIRIEAETNNNVFDDYQKSLLKELEGWSKKIVEYIKRNPDKIDILKNFCEVLQPKTNSILESYVKISEIEDADKFTRERLNNFLNKMKAVYKKEYEKLILSSYKDLEDELSVMESEINSKMVLGEIPQIVPQDSSLNQFTENKQVEIEEPSKKTLFSITAKIG